MSAHKCNKCLHQAYVKLASGSKEFCLAIDYEISEQVKNCSEFFDSTKLKEPEDFLDELDNLIKNPTTTEKRKITRLKNKITMLRLWGEQGMKPKMKK